MSGGVDSSVTAALLAGAGLRRRRHHAAALRPRRRGRDARAPAAPARTFTTRRASPRRIGIPHYVLDYESALPRRGDRRFRRRLSARRDADPLRRLQSDGEVPRPAGDGARSRRRGAGDRPLCAPGRRARTGRSCIAPSMPRATRAISSSAPRAPQLDFLRFPARRHEQGRDARARAPLRAAGRRQARQPGHLLRAERLLRRRRRPSCGRARSSRARSSIATARVLGRHDGIIHFTVGQRKGLGIAGGGAALRAAARAGDASRRGRTARGAGEQPRRAHSQSIGSAPRAAARRRGACRSSCARRSRRSPARLYLDGGPRRRCSTSRRSASRRARPACSMTATACLGGGWIARDDARGLTASGSPHQYPAPFGGGVAQLVRAGES